MAKLKQFLSKYLADTRGNMALSFALAGVPMMAAVGLAIDAGRAHTAKSELQSYVDNVALTAAATTGESEIRKQSANKYATKARPNIYGIEFSEPQTKISGKLATTTLTAKVEGTLTDLFLNKHSSGLEFPVTAEADWKQSEDMDICFFATSEHADNAIWVAGSGWLRAVSCSLYANSDSASAIKINGNSRVEAEAYYAVGQEVIVGNPRIEAESGDTSTVLEDPYDIEINESAVNSNDGTCSTPVLSLRYYRNITINGNCTITFSPGVHFVTGKIKMTGGTLASNRSTIVLYGENADWDMSGQSRVNLRAATKTELQALITLGPSTLHKPTDIQFAGIAIIGYTDAAGTLSSKTIKLTGGSNSEIIGMVYTPNHDVELGGNGNLNVNSKYSPIVANTIKTAGTGDITIGLDYDAYGFERPEELFVEGERTVRLVR